MSAAILSALFGLDAKLSEAGEPPLSGYWRRECARFYTSVTARVLCENVGRGGFKSLASIRMAIAETLEGKFTIAPSERHYFAHISENTQEADKTLGVCESYLRLLHVPFHRVGDVIELDRTNRGIRVLACRIGAVSGFRVFGWTCDEMSKWPGEGSDPSSEILASIRAMTITHPTARGRMFSSPLTQDGTFYETWARGDTDTTLTGHAPSWVANDSITEAHTHTLEEDPKVWAREYLAQAGSGIEGLDPEQVRAMVRELGPSAMNLGSPVMVIDSSSGRGDGWAYGIARYVREGGRRVLYVTDVGAVEGKFHEKTSFDDVVALCAGLARRRGAVLVFGDQHQGFALESAFRSYGLGFQIKSTSQSSLVDSLSTLRRVLRDRTIVVEPSEEGRALARETLTLKEVLSKNREFTVRAKRLRGHADRASLLLLAARIESEIPGAHTPGDTTPDSLAARVAAGNAQRSRSTGASWTYGGSGGRPQDWHYAAKDEGELMNVGTPDKPQFVGNKPRRLSRDVWRGWNPGCT